MTHHVVVCRDADGIGRRTALQRLVATVADRRGDRVTVGFLTGAAPSLTTALDEAAAGGARRVVVVPFAVPPDRNLASWARRVASAWTAANEAVDVLLATTPDADGAPALEAALDADPVPIAPVADAICDPDWSRVPIARRHVLICRGPRCSARGAAANHERLTAELDARGLGDDDVLVTRTGCLFPCNRGPVAVVQPDDVWYGGLDEQLVRRVVDEHLAGGRVVDQAALERGRDVSG